MTRVAPGMQAGVAGADVTPKPGPPLLGHGGKSSHSVFAPLEVRAVVFERGARRVGIVTVDTLGISKESTERIRTNILKECGIRPDHMLIAYSHTHCAPGTVQILDDKPYEPFLCSVETQAVRCIVKAMDSLQPVRLGLGCGSAHFNINRRPPPGATDMAPNEAELVDRRARVLTVESEDGNLVAVLFHYVCHPTTLPGTKGIISPDYPGVARTRIESKLGCKALFLPGCAGNIRPNIQNGKGGFAAATLAQLNTCGWELGDEVVRVARSVKSEPHTRLYATNRPLVLHYGKPMPRAQLQAIVRRHEAGKDEPLGPWARGVIAKMAAKKLPKSRTVEMQLLQIGPLAIVTMPGEPVIEIGHAIEKQCRAMKVAADCWPLGYSNDALAYFCTPQQHKAGGYEPNAYMYDNQHAPYEGEAKAIVNTAVKLLEKIR